jgi:hypothetical protein
MLRDGSIAYNHGIGCRAIVRSSMTTLPSKAAKP